MIPLIAFLFLLHLCMIDVKMWSSPFNAHKWYNSDWVYLGGSFIVFVAIGLYLGSRGWFASGLIGWIVWDYVFGYLVEDDPLCAYRDYFNGWGFTAKWQRITWDVLRLAGAIILW